MSGINNESPQPDIVRAHKRALELFEIDLVSPLSPIGHNFVQSFCVFPSGSGNQRSAQIEHEAALSQFCDEAAALGLDFVAVRWTDDQSPTITRAHDDELSHGLQAAPVPRQSVVDDGPCM